MQDDLKFIPKIFLCGDETEFFSQVGNRPFKIVGKVKIFYEDEKKLLDFLQDGKILFNDEVKNFDELLKLLQSGTADYLVVNNFNEYGAFRNYILSHNLFPTQVITLEHFKTLNLEFFNDVNADISLLLHLKNSAIKTLLDVDGYFAKGQLFTKVGNDFTEIDVVSDKLLPSIAENIYTHVYKNLSEVGFKRYDAALIVERAGINFDSMFVMLENFTDTVITYARTGSELEQHILNSVGNFSNVNGLRTVAGNWFFLRRHTPPENFCVYVVCYKPTPHDGKLPDGYKIIQAGRALNPDLGYIGDNTGENISHLNLYLNEITALYWFWKNTTHTVVGLVHYRRFFTELDNRDFAYEKILTKDAALKILERYDIIISKVSYEFMIQQDLLKNDCGYELPIFAEGIIKKHMLKAQPDYVETFENLMNSVTMYRSHLFITRRNVLDAYCKWLFSFIVDATEEVLRSVPLANLPFSPRRLMAFLAERMLTVWLIKNRLRIKELPFMFIEGI